MGEKTEGGATQLPIIAQWLQQEKRLKIISLSRQIQSDFLVSFLYVLKNDYRESLPLPNLIAKFHEYPSKLKKVASRKLNYYASRIEDFLKSVLPSSINPKYTIKDTKGLDDLRSLELRPEVIGFAFVNAKNDLKAIYEIKQNFEDSEIHKTAGIKTVLDYLVVTRSVKKTDEKIKKKIRKRSKSTGNEEKTLNLTHNAFSVRIYDSFKDYIMGFQTIASELDEPDFLTITVDNDTKMIFSGIYLYLTKHNDLGKIQEDYNTSILKVNENVKMLNKIATNIQEFEDLTSSNIQVRNPLEMEVIQEFGKLLAKYQNSVLPYTKFLMTRLSEKILLAISQATINFEKKFGELKDDLEDKLRNIQLSINKIDEYDLDFFEFLNVTKEDIKQNYQLAFTTACNDFISKAYLDVEDPPDSAAFLERLNSLEEDFDLLENIHNCVQECKTIAHAINEDLKNW